MMIIVHCVEDSLFRSALLSVYVPMMYAVMGFRDAEHDGMRRYAQGRLRPLIENLRIILAGICLVLVISLVDYCRLPEPSWSALGNALIADGVRLFYMYGVSHGGHGAVGVVWLMGSLAIVRIVYGYAHRLVRSAIGTLAAAWPSYRTRLLTAGSMSVVAIVLCMISMVLTRREIWLPLSLDVSGAGMLFYALGAFYYAVCQWITHFRQKTGETEEHAARWIIRVPLTFLCVAYWAVCLHSGLYMEIVTRQYQDVRVIVEAVAAIYAVTQIGSAILHRVPWAANVLGVAGRHPFLFIGFHDVDMYLAFLWNVADPVTMSALKCAYGTGIVAIIQCVRMSSGMWLHMRDAHTVFVIRTWYRRHRRLVNRLFYGFYALILALQFLRSTMFTQNMDWTLYNQLYMIGMDGLFAVVLLRFVLPLGQQGEQHKADRDQAENDEDPPGEAVGDDDAPVPASEEDRGTLVQALRGFVNLLRDPESARSAYIRHTILRMTLLITCLMLWDLNWLTAQMVLGLLMIGAEETSARRILQIYLVVGFAEMVIMYWASMHGYIAYLYYATVDAHAMGSIYRTDYAAHWLYLLIAYNILRGRRLRLVEYMAEGCLIYYVFHLTTGKTFLISAPLFLVLCYVANGLPQIQYRGRDCSTVVRRGIVQGIFYQNDPYRDKNHEALCCSETHASTETAGIRGGRERLNRGNIIRIFLNRISCLIFPLCAVGSYIVALTIGSQYAGITSLTGAMATFQHRLGLSYTAFHQYPIRLFSQSVTEQGAGGLVDWNTSANYFFLDNAYIRMLIIHGVLFLVIILVTHTALMRRAVREHRYIIWCALVAIAVDSLSEHHMPTFSYNILPVIIWAEWNLQNPDAGASVPQQGAGPAAGENATPAPRDEQDNTQ